MNIMHQEDKKKYEKYVKKVTPTHNLPIQVGKAFLAGGLICTLGQWIQNVLIQELKLEKDMSQTWCSLLLILLSVILTTCHLYNKIVKWAGAGALVPITGFANSVAACAIEFKKEGQVFGIGCKIFTIAGPVILYGIFTSWVLGVVYWVMKMVGAA